MFSYSLDNTNLHSIFSSKEIESELRILKIYKVASVTQSKIPIFLMKVS